MYRPSQGRKLLDALARNKETQGNEFEKPKQVVRNGQPAAASVRRQEGEFQKPKQVVRNGQPAAASVRLQEVSDTVSEFSPSEADLLAPEYAEKLKRTECWIDKHRNLSSNGMASDFDSVDNFQVLTPVLPLATNQESWKLTPTELTPGSEHNGNLSSMENMRSELGGNDYIELLPVSNTPVFMENYLDEYTPCSEVIATIPPSLNCKKRLFHDAMSAADGSLGTAPLEPNTQSLVNLTSNLPPDAEIGCQTITLDKNENVMISSTEAPQQAEEIIIPITTGLSDDHNISFTEETSKDDEVELQGESTVQDSVEQLGTPNDTVSKKRTRQAACTPKSPTRKRQRCPSQDKAAKIKEAYNKGLPHTTRRGKERDGRSLKPGCTGKCRRSCQARITKEQRQRVFNSYYSSGNKASQWLMISKMVRKKPVQRRTVIAESPRRKMSYSYFLPDESGNLIPVCQKMFVDTLDISMTVVHSSVKKNSPDKRGKHVEKRVRIAPDLIQGVKDHIKSFPKIESHYCREDTKRQYLQENLSVSRMYRMYIAQRGKDTPNTASLRQYQDIFNNSFNIGFYKPKKDQCSLCARWNALREEERVNNIELGREYNEHVQAKNLVREIRKDIKTLSRSEESKEMMIRVICFDLQKVFFCPKSDVGEFFYKRKISCYNFTIFDCTSKKAFCYVWDQTVGGRGAAEISSCVLMYIKQEAASGVKELHIFSDSCWSQNKNQILFTMYSVASQKYGIKIVHRYLQKGHTQMECDSVHARIEKKTKDSTIFTPSVWYGFIQSAKVQRPMYTVIKVSQVDIVSFKDLAHNHFTWSKVPISKVHEIIVDCAIPGKISFKRKLSDEETMCEVLVKKPGRPFNWVTYQPPRLYDKPLALKPNLIKDLKWMITHNLIPAADIAFYENVTSPDFGIIVHQEGAEDDNDFADEVAPVQDVSETNDTDLLDDPEEVEDEHENSDIDSEAYD